MSEDEPKIIKEFRGLYEYVRLMGEHINQIHDRLDKLEKNIADIVLSQRNYALDNTREISNLRENMVNKNEFNEFMNKMKSSMGELLPTLPTLGKKTDSDVET